MLRHLVRIGLILLLSSSEGWAQIGDLILVERSETAVELAKVLVREAHGGAFVSKHKFTAKSEDGTWIVLGRHHSAQKRKVMGGLIEIHIRKSDAQVTFFRLHL